MEWGVLQANVLEKSNLCRWDVIRYLIAARLGDAGSGYKDCLIRRIGLGGGWCPKSDLVTTGGWESACVVEAGSSPLLV